jgi:hypothetical protein
MGSPDSSLSGSPLPTPSPIFFDRSFSSFAAPSFAALACYPRDLERRRVFAEVVVAGRRRVRFTSGTRLAECGSRWRLWRPKGGPWLGSRAPTSSASTSLPLAPTPRRGASTRTAAGCCTRGTSSPRFRPLIRECLCHLPARSKIHFLLGNVLNGLYNCNQTVSDMKQLTIW